MMSSPMQGRFTSGYKTSKRPTHAGIDIAPPVAGTVGSPVYAALPGKVVRIANTRKPGQTNSVGALATGRTGNGVIIQNSDGRKQLYNHVAPTVKVGQTVSAGTLIGRTDRSGNQTGPHLHFETWNANGTTYNPVTLFNQYGVTIGSAPKTGATSATVSKDDQARLHTVGGPYYNGLIDGVAGPTWDAAVRAFQRDNGLVVDGYFGPLSRDLFDRKYRALFLDIQGKLASRGFYTGVRDGYSGQLTYNAIVAFQKSRGLNATGEWDVPTDTAYKNSQPSNPPPPPPPAPVVNPPVVPPPVAPPKPAPSVAPPKPAPSVVGVIPPEPETPPVVWEPWPEPDPEPVPKPEWPVPSSPTRPEQLVAQYASGASSSQMIILFL